MRRSPLKEKSLISSPKTPVKSFKKSNKNDICLVCGINFKLNGVTVFFNVKSCPGLVRILGREPCEDESVRVCIICKRKVHSILSKELVIGRLIEEIRSKDELSRTAQETQKRLPKDSPSSHSSNRLLKRLKSAETRVNSAEISQTKVCEQVTKDKVWKSLLDDEEISDFSILNAPVVKVVVVKREHHSEYWYSGSLLTLKSPSCYKTSSQQDHD